MIMKGTYLLAALALCVSCSNGTRLHSEMPEVNLIASTSEVEQLDKLVSDIEAVKLDSAIKMPMPPNKLLVYGDNLIALSTGRIFEFTSSGKFVRYIGQIGDAPGEYQHLLDCCINLSGNELLCLTHMNEVFRYSLPSGEYIGKISVGNLGVTATAVLPLSDGRFGLFYSNPAQSDIMNFDDEFNCVRIYDASGKEVDAMQPRDDFNIGMCFATPSIQSLGGSYVLSYRPGDGPCYEIGKDGIVPFCNITFGDIGIPAREMVTGVDNPWDKIADVFETDYFKSPSSVCRTDDIYYFSAFGKQSSVWNFVLDKSLRKGFRWQSVGGSRPPMCALAADDEYVYFCYGETGLTDSSMTRDPLQKLIIDRLGLALGKGDNPAIIKVKFNCL